MRFDLKRLDKLQAGEMSRRKWLIVAVFEQRNMLKDQPENKKESSY